MNLRIIGLLLIHFMGFLSSAQSCTYQELDMIGSSTLCNEISTGHPQPSITPTRTSSTTSSSTTPTAPPLDRPALQTAIKDLCIQSRRAAANLQRCLTTHFLSRGYPHNMPQTPPCFYEERSADAIYHPHPRTDFRERLRNDYASLHDYCQYFHQISQDIESDNYRSSLDYLIQSIGDLKENLRALLRIVHPGVLLMPDRETLQSCTNTSYPQQVATLQNMQEFTENYIPRDIDGLKDSVKS